MKFNNLNLKETNKSFTKFGMDYKNFLDIMNNKLWRMELFKMPMIIILKEILNYFSILITEICIIRLLSYEEAIKEVKPDCFKKVS